MFICLQFKGYLKSYPPSPTIIWKIYWKVVLGLERRHPDHKLKFHNHCSVSDGTLVGLGSLSPEFSWAVCIFNLPLFLTQAYTFFFLAMLILESKGKHWQCPVVCCRMLSTSRLFLSRLLQKNIISSLSNHSAKGSWPRISPHGVIDSMLQKRR